MRRVYAFDRDRTVDVNPPPDRAAVPLAWIESLRERSDVDVWAIGNQRLRYEAAIPGVPELLSKSGSGRLRPRLLVVLLWLEWHLHRYPGFRSLFSAGAPHVDDSMMPSRVERLHLLERLYDGETQLVVVDDVDLSGVDRWRHYYPWEFVEAVESGAFEADIDPSPASARSDSG